MQIHLLVGVQKGEDVPYVADAWDEYTVNENPEGWEDAKRSHRVRGVNGEYERTAVVTVEVDYDTVWSALYPAVPEPVEGRVVSTEHLGVDTGKAEG